MTTVIRRRTGKTEKPKLTPRVKSKIANAFMDNRKLKADAAEATKAADKLRDNDLLPDIEAYGEPYGDQGQHRAIVLDDEVDGYNAVVRQRNVSRGVDVDKAEALAERKGVLPQVQTCTLSLTDIPGERYDALLKALETAGLEAFGDVVVRREFSQDRLYAYHQQHRDVITPRDLDKIIVETESFSLVARKV